MFQDNFYGATAPPSPPKWFRALIIIEVSSSHSDTPHSVGLLWTSDKPDTGTSTYTTHNTYNRQTSMPPAGFEPIITASERPQTHAPDRAATGIGFRTVL